MASAYQGAVESVLAVVISGLAGYWVDRRFGTEPTGFLVGMAIGFAAFGLRMWRMRNLMGAAGPGSTSGTSEPSRDDAGGGPPESK
jgi:F0F1-type ATP synthase assembly protein I